MCFRVVPFLLLTFFTTLPSVVRCFEEKAEVKNELTQHNVKGKEINAPKCIFEGFVNVSALALESHFSLDFFEVETNRSKPLKKIKCQASYPIDFEFDGVLPVNRELWVNFFITYDGRSITFQMDICYFGMTVVNTNPSGKYSIFSVDRPSLKTSFYVFDSHKNTPQLFRPNGLDNNQIKIVDNTRLIIECRSSVYEAEVLLFEYHIGVNRNKEMKQIGPSKTITYESSVGFSWNITEQSSLELNHNVTDFAYVCVCNKCVNGSNSLEFRLASSLAANNGISVKKLSAGLTIYIKIVNDETQISCTYQYGPIPNLTNIDAENSRDLSLNVGCLVENSNQKKCHQQRTSGTYADYAILRPAHSRGLAICTDQTNSGIKITKEYFRGVDDVIYYDWNVALKSKDALLKIQCTNSEKIYANLTYKFTCAFTSYILSPSLFLQVYYADGSTQMHLYQSNNKGDDKHDERTREVSFVLFSNVTAVSCSSLPWNSSVFVNSSMEFRLRDKTFPKFDTAETEESKTFMLKYTNMQLQCTASGDELPYIIFEKDGMPLNDSNLKIKSEPGRSTIIFPPISYEHKGDYKCKAINSMGLATKMYHVYIEDPDQLNYRLVIGLSLGALGVLLATIVTAFTISRYFYKKRLYLTQEEIEEFKNGSDKQNQNDRDEDQVKLMENINCRPYNEKYEIHSSKFQFDRSCILGSGQFGIVYKGLYNHEPIAIKTLKPYTEKIYLKALLSELKVMIYLNGHRHVVNLVGANTESLQRGLVYVFVEFCPLGNLEGFLRRHQNNFVNQISVDGTIKINNSIEMTCDPETLYTKDLILWSTQISSGMEYLASKRVIHGDLATRNILLSNRETAKITDFGLSKKLYDYEVYHKKNQVPLPWRWMAIESLQNMTFSTKTDVWAFGVTLWEIFTLANVPYPGLSWSPEFVKQLELNMRMAQPHNASSEIYDLMRLCWEVESCNRPTFTYISEFFSGYLKKFEPQSEYSDLF